MAPSAGDRSPARARARAWRRRMLGALLNKFWPNMHEKKERSRDRHGQVQKAQSGARSQQPTGRAAERPFEGRRQLHGPCQVASVTALAPAHDLLSPPSQPRYQTHPTKSGSQQSSWNFNPPPGRPPTWVFPGGGTGFPTPPHTHNTTHVPPHLVASPAR